jgi:hypothetical protein
MSLPRPPSSHSGRREGGPTAETRQLPNGTVEIHYLHTAELGAKPQQPQHSRSADEDALVGSAEAAARRLSQQQYLEQRSRPPRR